MSISAAIRSRLISDSTITSVVGQRITALIVPQHPNIPCVTFDQGMDNRTRTFDGQNDLTEAFFDVDAWAQTYDEAKSLQRKLIASLKDMDGRYGDVYVFQSTASSGPDVYEASVNLYRCNVQLQIFYR